MRTLPAHDMPKLYLNLDRRTDRRARMEQCIGRHTTLSNLERWTACDGHRVTDFSRLPAGVRISARQQRHIAARGPSRGGMHSAGSVGLAISYKTALDHIIEQGWQYTLLFEDDACFTDDFDARFAGLYMPADADMVYLGQSSAPSSEPVDGIYLRAHRVYGLFAVIWSLAGARKVVETLRLFDPLKYALDTRLFYGLDRADLIKYCLIEPIVRHPPQHSPEDPSDILLRAPA